MTIAWTRAMLDKAPRIVDRRATIKGVLRGWRQQYPDRSRFKVEDALAQLDLTTCDRADVDTTIGNDSWTRLECDVCQMDRDRLVAVPRDYGDDISICSECANGVLVALKEPA